MELGMENFTNFQWRINLTGQVLFFILEVEWGALNERSRDMSERLDGQIYSLISHHIVQEFLISNTEC